MKKSCELCKRLARMHCESDQASLCWSCDFKVHSANFLVARHSRTLLCHVCQSPTPWTATGTKLGPTVSVCDNCRNDEETETEIESNNRTEESRELEEEEDEDENENENDNVGEEEEEEDDDEDEDNQVVPWSPTTPPPPPSASSNSDEDYDSSSSSSFSSSSRRDPTESRRKRMRKNASDLCLNENYTCAYSRENVNRPPESAVACSGGRGRSRFLDSLSTIQEEREKRRRLGSGRLGPFGGR